MSFPNSSLSNKLLGRFRKDPKNITKPRTPYTPAKWTAGTPFSHEGLLQMIFPDFKSAGDFQVPAPAVNFPKGVAPF